MGMTIEDCILALTKERKTALHENKQAFDMAIKALEQEPILDMIRARIDKPIIRDEYSQRQNDYCDGYEFVCNQIREIIDKYKAEIKAESEEQADGKA